MILARRTMLSALAAAPVAIGMSSLLEAAAPRGFFARHGLPIGLQLYTLLGQNPTTGLDAVFALVAKLGYRTVELPNLLGHKPAEIRAAADKAGVAITSLHLPLMGLGPSLSMVSEPAKIADALGTLGAKWAAAPILLIPAGFKLGQGETFATAISRSVAAAGPDIFKKTAATLNERAALLKPLGIGVAYHNHNLEFAPIGSTTGYDILLRETDPRLVHFEVDIGWVAAAGLDPVAFLHKMRGRASHLHVKDLLASSPKNYAIEMQSTEVGSGRLKFRPILDAAYAAGIRHFYVEQEPPFAIPREESAARSIAFLKGI